MAGKKILTDLEVKGYIDVDGGIKDANGDFGNSGQFLQTSSTDVVWANTPGQGGNITFVGNWAKEFTWGTNQTGVTFSGSGSSEYGTFAHNLGTKDIVVSVRAVEDDDGTNNIGYDEDELADVGYDPFLIIANGTNTVKVMQVASSNAAGVWAITIIG